MISGARLRGAGLGLLLAVAVAGAVAAVPAFFPASAERGRMLATLCLTCHASTTLPEGPGAINPPRLFGQRPEAIFRALLGYQHGERTSPIMAPIALTLSLQDMRDLGAYLAAEGPVRPPKPAGLGSWAREKVHRDCTACHGETGMGEMWGIPVLTGQNREYLVSALMAYREGTRTDATMRPIAAQLTPEEIGKLADYFSQQSHLRIER